MVYDGHNLRNRNWNGQGQHHLTFTFEFQKKRQGAQLLHLHHLAARQSVRGGRGGEGEQTKGDQSTQCEQGVKTHLEVKAQTEQDLVKLS